MNCIGRQDRVLLGGLAVALIVLFAKPMRYLLDLARDVEQRSGLALVPVLIILAGVFLFHQQSKRLEAKARASAAEADALQAGARVTEMERLVPIERTRQPMVDHALITDAAWASDAIASDGHLCRPMTAGGHPVGVVGIPHSAGPFTVERKRMLARAGALLAISLRNAQLFHDLRENSLRDGLTGCFNRTHALDLIDAELRPAQTPCRSSCSTSILSRPSTIGTAACAAMPSSRRSA